MFTLELIGSFFKGKKDRNTNLVDKQKEVNTVTCLKQMQNGIIVSGLGTELVDLPDITETPVLVITKTPAPKLDTPAKAKVGHGPIKSNYLRRRQHRHATDIA